VLDRGFHGIYCNVTDLLDRLRGSYRQGADEEEAEILADMEGAELLVLDDLGAEKATDWVRDRLYLIVNRRYENSKPLIVTTNCDDVELRDRVGPRIVSRLYEMCAPVDKFPEEDYRYARLR
jgi:DNA replication protein DnaC